MMSRTFERRTLMAALLVVTAQMLGISGPADAAQGQDTLLEPTPLVLKDGRIANVSIYVLAFGPGDGVLDPAAVAQLSRLTAEVATDCFLTAQVIGHVSSREVAENETLAAHRLARSRADAVQASLIGGGLPAKSIASVWDWQFLVREPRATLWVFRLIQGEDCEGVPLDGDAPQLVADNTVPAQAEPERATAAAAAPVVEADAVAQAATPAPVADAEAPPPAQQQALAAPADQQAAAGRPAPVAGTLPMVRSAVAAEAPSAGTPPAAATESSEALDAIVAAVVDAEAEVGESARAVPEQPAASAVPPDVARAGQAPGTAGAGTEPAPQARPGQAEDVAVAAPSAVGAAPTVTRPIPALSPSQPPSGTAGAQAPETVVAAVSPAPQAAARAAAPPSPEAQDPSRQGKVEWGRDGDVVITFATNSSYFPPGTTRRLSTMVESMSGAERYRVQLEVGTSGTDKVVGATNPEEARRYNRWLAERRMVRVQDWLKENAHDRQLEIEPVFQADDSSRRVVVRVVPVS